MKTNVNKRRAAAAARGISCSAARALRAASGLGMAAVLTSGLVVAADAPPKAGPAGPSTPAAKVNWSMPDDFSGAWTHDPQAGLNPSKAKPDDKVFTMSDGTPIPLLPAAEKLYRERVVMSATEHPYANTSSRCLPIGTPGNMMGAPYPIEIVQRPEFIGMLFEEGWMFRTIFMNGKHPDEMIPSFMGHSTGHWEGKTLVIDTVGLREETTLNFTGLPHSTSMHVVERLTRTAPEELTDLIEVTDPVMYSKPLKFVSIFKKTKEELIEYVCEDSRIEVTPDGRQTYGDSPSK